MPGGTEETLEPAIVLWVCLAGKLRRGCREGRGITVVKQGIKWWLGEPEEVLRPLGLFRMFDSAEEFKEGLVKLAGQ